MRFLAVLRPVPHCTVGLKAKLTMTLALNGESNRRLVMRAYKTNANLKSANAGTPIFLVSLTQESLRKSLRAYVVPTLVAAKAAASRGSLRRIWRCRSNTRAVTEQRLGDGGEVRLITLP